jgi:hypothetical protein
MKNCSSIFLPALLGFANISTPVSQECPRLSLKAKVRPDAKREILVAKGKSAITVTLESNDPVNKLEFKLNLPNDLTAKRTVMLQSPICRRELLRTRTKRVAFTRLVSLSPEARGENIASASRYRLLMCL